MSGEIKLYESMPVSLPRSEWLLRILASLPVACKMPQIPMEIRPLDCAGKCVYNESDKRVYLSKKIVFWSRASVAQIYLHECAHRLLQEEDIAAHGVEFFTLLLVLHLRAKSHLISLGASEEPLLDLSFYECWQKSKVWQKSNIDPSDWWSTQAQWAIDTAYRLASSADDAPALAKRVPEMWRENVKNLRTVLEQESKDKRQQRDEIIEIKGRADNYRRAFFFTLFCLLLLLANLFQLK